MTRRQVHVAVVGAGLGGLAAAIGISRAGHLVTIFEQAQVLSEVGAGIQIPPNSSSILKRWGLLPQMQSFSVEPQFFIFRSYKTGNILQKQPLNPDSDLKYGAPYFNIHRADFHHILVQEAQRLGVKIRLRATVQHINFEKPSLELKDGSEFHADIIVGADGINSVCREAILGRADPPHLTGDLAYRITVKAEDMKKHPELVDLTVRPSMNYWLGPDAHAISYPLKEGGGLYNIVLVRPDDMPELVHTAIANVQEMLDFFEHWDPKVRALVSIAQETLKWRLLSSTEMKQWSHPSGKCVLLGDAAHATLPYLAQGAAMAVEDGAVLGLLFEKLQTKEQLSDILMIFERIRKARTTRVVRESSEVRQHLHLHDGARQRERDRQLLEEPPFEGFPNRFADPELQPWLYAYDPQAVVDHAWELYLRGQFPGTEGNFKAKL
ncbi:unnamed protein product [Calypogeia fissa]